MINFEDRVGPTLDPPVAYPNLTVPNWWRDAKLGLFVHWGIYSVPAWALPHDGVVPVEDAYARHSYAEWYANTVRIPGSPTRDHHCDTYGVGTTYEDLADQWVVDDWSAQRFVEEVSVCQAKYLIPTTKHHDGFCLWNTSTTGFNSCRRGPRRDIIAELTAATRRQGLRLGLYFSGAHDWHVSDLPAIHSDVDLFVFRRNDDVFARYVLEQLTELVGSFAPDILWNDIDWPDAGKGNDEIGLGRFLSSFIKENPDGVVNDRWGIPAHGFITREYTRVDRILGTPWEATRGLGASFGYNQLEGPEMTLSAPEAVRFLVDVVSKNGNLLLNVGPDAQGRVPSTQLATLQGLGEWLTVWGEAIFATRPWRRHGDDGLRYTTGGQWLFAHVMEPGRGSLRMPEDIDLTEATWLDGEPVAARNRVLDVPPRLQGHPVAVVRIPRWETPSDA